MLGATGFIGRYVVAELLRRNHSVVAVARNTSQNLNDLHSSESGFRFVELDLYSDESYDPQGLFGPANVVIDLVWPGLPNYKDRFHFEVNQLRSYTMLKRFICNGYRNILVAGTCYEYGLQSGPITDLSVPNPVVAYGAAKHGLHQWLRMLQNTKTFKLKWARLFYLHGQGQAPGSIIPQLLNSIKAKHKIFEMSAGEQLRDFLPVEQAAEYLVNLAQQYDLNGDFNVCSGTPISIRKLVEHFIQLHNAKIDLKLGHYSMPAHEPLAFWGVPSPETFYSQGNCN